MQTSALRILRWTVVAILVKILLAVAAAIVLAAFTGSGVDSPWALGTEAVEKSGRN